MLREREGGNTVIFEDNAGHITLDLGTAQDYAYLRFILQKTTNSGLDGMYSGRNTTSLDTGRELFVQ